MSDPQPAVPGRSEVTLDHAGRRRHIGVVMQRRSLASPWRDYAWLPARVEHAAALTEPRLTSRVEGCEEWLHPELPVELFPDEAEGYYLNLSAPAPAVFVHWSDEDGSPRILGLTVSYHQASRLMDGGMQVDTVPLPPEWREWVAAFIAAHYKPEQAHPRARPPSFDGARRGPRKG